MLRLKLVLASLSLLSALLVGWTARGWHQGYLESKQLKQEAEATAAGQQASEVEAQTLSHAAAKTREEIEDEHAEIEQKIREASGLRCLSDVAAGLHYDVIRALSANDTRRVGCNQQ